MYAASYSRTMANARPKFRQEDVQVVNIIELRKEKAEQAEREARERAIRSKEEIRRQFRVAQDTVKAGRDAAAAFNYRHGSDDEDTDDEVLEAEQEAPTRVPYRHSYAVIERRACRVFRLTKVELLSKRRHRDVAFARQFIMYWACRLTIRSLPEIGRLMGGRDHTTCLHGKRVYPQKRAKMGRHLRQVR